ncbi:Cathepsin_B [Hexamita inflata]|uniref:Cathepsin B n=1 Tax=Hexamita inflata TaxID=28002 RepID=A0AA86TLG9_9EUKA|nr:Cathepsin B [Hexamita inflata]
MIHLIIFSQQQAFLNEAMLEMLQNIPDMTWNSEIPTRFKNQTKSQIMQAILPNKQLFNVQKSYYSSPVQSSFNWLDLKPNCFRVFDQGDCSSCWAFSAVGSFSSNRCINSTDIQRVDYSAQYLISCDSGDAGCEGGRINQSLLFLKKTGVPTETCVRYSSFSGVSPKCPTTCDDGSKLTFFKSGRYEDVCSSEQSIMSTLQSQTIITSFLLYEDFFYYRNGIYQHKTGSITGGHTVVLTGFGEENGVKFWRAKNSWGTSWGENGFFRIKRGNECGIEDQCFVMREK